MMATQRDILKAVEGLPQGLLEQVKDFIARLKEKKGAQKASLHHFDEYSGIIKVPR